MLFLNKLLPVFVLPLGVVLALVLLALRQKWRWLGLVAAGVLYGASLPVVGEGLIGRLERVYPRWRVAEAPAADVVLVLGGTMGPPVAAGYLPNWADAVERFEGGVALVQAGRAPQLLFTGAPRSADGAGESEGAAMRALAIARGVPAGRIDVTGPVGNTADEARALARWCAERGVRRVLVVSSAWHLPRAMRQLRRSGLELTAFPVDFRATTAGRKALPYMDWLPSAGGGLALTETALREVYGIAFYTVTGWGR